MQPCLTAEPRPQSRLAGENQGGPPATGAWVGRPWLSPRVAARGLLGGLSTPALTRRDPDLSTPGFPPFSTRAVSN